MNVVTNNSQPAVLDSLQAGLKNLGEETAGGFLAKFSAHTKKVMEREGATSQATGTAALLLGGAEQIGLLSAIGAALGTTITFPPAAAGIALAGGALFLAIGTYKAYGHAKKAAIQKAAENNTTATTGDIVSELVKQTVENIVFGAPAILLKFAPGLQKKLNDCVQKYEAKQALQKGASSLSEQFGKLKNIQNEIANNIDDIKNTTETKINGAKTKIQTEINKAAQNYLNKKLDDLNNQLNDLGVKNLAQLQELVNVDPLSHLKEIGDSLGLQDYSQTIFDKVRKEIEQNAQQLGDLGKSAILSRLENARTIDDLKELKKLAQDLDIDAILEKTKEEIKKEIKEKIQGEINDIQDKLPTKQVSEAINKLNQLKQEINNTKEALQCLIDNKGQPDTEQVKTILQGAKNEAKQLCQEQIDKIKNEAKKELTTFINQETGKIKKDLESKMNTIEQGTNEIFAELEKAIEAINSKAGNLEALKTQTKQKIDTIKNLDFMQDPSNTISNLIGSLDFQEDTNFDQISEAFDKAKTNANNLTASLAENAAKKFIEIGVQEAKEVGSRTTEEGYSFFENKFKEYGISFD